MSFKSSNIQEFVYSTCFPTLPCCFCSAAALLILLSLLSAAAVDQKRCHAQLFSVLTRDKIPKKMPQKSSWVWNHMTKDENEAVCNYCKHRLTQAKGYGSSTLAYHLKKKHQDKLAIPKHKVKQQSQSEETITSPQKILPSPAKKCKVFMQTTLKSGLKKVILEELLHSWLL